MICLHISLTQRSKNNKTNLGLNPGHLVRLVPIHVDPNHTNSNQPIPDNSTHIGSIHNSDDIFATDTVLTSPVYSTVQASQIFNYVSESDPSSPPNDSSSENVTPILNTKPHYKPPNPVPNVPDEPDSDPSLSYYSSSESSDSSDDEYYKQRQRSKKDNNKLRSKTRFDDIKY